MPHKPSNQAKEKKERREKYVLAMETAFTGSLSILSNRKIVAGWRGSHRVSRAEDVLERIAELFNRSEIEKQSVERIVVSKGAGSLTGEKIGLAIARGFCKAIGCRLVEGSIFEALLKEIPGALKGRYLTAVATEKNIHYREFDSSSSSENFLTVTVPDAVSKSAFIEKLSGEYKGIVIAEISENSENVEAVDLTSDSRLVITKKSLAEILGTA